MDGPPTPSAGGDPAVAWLLESSEPAIRRLAQRDLLGEPGPEDDLAVLGGPKVSALLAGQQPDGGFGGHPYRKWGGAPPSTRPCRPPGACTSTRPPPAPAGRAGRPGGPPGFSWGNARFRLCAPA